MIGAGAIVLAAMYMLRLISAVLHEARGSTVARRGARPAAGRARARRAARRRAARPLGVAGRDQAPLVRRRLSRRSSRGASSSDQHAARRLVRALDDPRAARRLVRRAPLRRARAARRRGGVRAAIVSVARLHRRPRRLDLALRRQRRRPHGRRGRLLPRPLDGARADHPLRDRPRTTLAPSSTSGSTIATARRDDHIAEFFALLLASAAGMAFFVGAANLMVLFLVARVVLDRALRHVRDRLRPRRARSRPA